MRGQNRSRRPELSRRPSHRDSLHSISRTLGKSSGLITPEKRGSGPRPSGYSHSRTGNTHKIANRKAATNRSYPAVLTGCVRLIFHFRSISQKEDSFTWDSLAYNRLRSATWIQLLSQSAATWLWRQ